VLTEGQSQTYRKREAHPKKSLAGGGGGGVGGRKEGPAQG